ALSAEVMEFDFAAAAERKRPIEWQAAVGNGQAKDVPAGKTQLAGAVELVPERPAQRAVHGRTDVTGELRQRRQQAAGIDTGEAERNVPAFAAAEIVAPAAAQVAAGEP